MYISFCFSKNDPVVGGAPLMPGGAAEAAGRGTASSRGATVALERLRQVLSKMSREERQEALQQLPAEAGRWGCRGGGGVRRKTWECQKEIHLGRRGPKEFWNGLKMT